MKNFYYFLTLLAALALPAALNAQVTAPYTQGFETMNDVNDLDDAKWEMLYKSDATVSWMLKQLPVMCKLVQNP